MTKKRGGTSVAKRRRSANALPPFVPLTWEMLNSLAYKELSPAAGKCLPYFLGKVKGKWNAPERYTSDFSFVYGEAQRYGFTRPTFARVIRELIGCGFIDGVDRGGLRGEGKSCNLFRLSRRWVDYGTAKFKVQRWDTVQPRVNTPVKKLYLNRERNFTYKRSNCRKASKEPLPVGANS